MLDRKSGEKMLVTVQGKGTQTPLIIAPDITGGGLLAERISQTLGADYPVYKLERLSENGIYISNFEEMAQIYSRQILEAGLRPPYQFLGYSFGAQVAYAVAVRMEEQNQNVGFVGLLDDESDVHLRMFNSRNEKGLFTDAVTAGRHAINRNSLRQYAGKVTLISADHWMRDRQFDTAFGWQFLAHGGVDAITFLCNHNEITAPIWLEKWLNAIKPALAPNPNIKRASPLKLWVEKWYGIVKMAYKFRSIPALFPPKFVHHPSQASTIPQAAWEAALCAQLGDIEGEISNYEHARRALQEVPEWISLNLAAAYIQVMDWTAAIEVLMQATRSATKVKNSHFELAQLLLFRGETGALKDLVETLKTLPGDTASDLQLKGAIFNVCNEIDLGEQAFHRALKLDPARTVCYRRCALMLAQNGQLDRAIILVESGVQKWPRAVFLRVLLAQLYEQSGDETTAETLLRRILLDDPGNPLALIPLCALLCRQGQTEQGLELVNSELAKKPWHTGLLNAAGELYLQAEQLDLAKKSYERSLALRGEFPMSRLGLSEVFEAMGQLDRALLILKQRPESLCHDARINRRIYEIQSKLEPEMADNELSIQT
ncbi:MAG: tetratricopeptide (TPR) repeat protein [Halocynthiibacter sp.]|jgi:tetratricopeptide (TPR) repeat protein